jgi:hypothetical protein
VEVSITYTRSHLYVVTNSPEATPIVLDSDTPTWTSFIIKPPRVDGPPSDPLSMVPSPQSIKGDTRGEIRQPQNQECLTACKSTIQYSQPPAVIPGSDQYLVKRIVSYKISQSKGYKGGVTEYLVKWEGYSDETNSYVQEIHEGIVKAYTTTAEKLLRRRVIRLGRRKKRIIEYLVKWGGYADDQSI